MEAQTDTSREIYREPAKDWKGNGYEPYAKVTPEGAIVMCAGGRCVTKPISGWAKVGWDYERLERESEAGKVMATCLESMEPWVNSPVEEYVARTLSAYRSACEGEK